MSVQTPVLGDVMTTVTMDQEQKERVGKAIGRIASGVYIVTTERKGERDGMLASWVMQAAFDPPMISVAIKHERHLLELLGVGQQFTVNVLSKNNMDIFKNFARPYEEGLDRFQGLKINGDKEAGPIFEDSVAYLKVVTRTMVEAGDHIIVLAEIFDGGMFDGETGPMVHFRKNGFQY